MLKGIRSLMENITIQMKQEIDVNDQFDGQQVFVNQMKSLISVIQSLIIQLENFFKQHEFQQKPIEFVNSPCMVDSNLQDIVNIVQQAQMEYMNIFVQQSNQITQLCNENKKKNKQVDRYLQCNKSLVQYINKSNNKNEQVSEQYHSESIPKTSSQIGLNYSQSKQTSCEVKNPSSVDLKSIFDGKIANFNSFQSQDINYYEQSNLQTLYNNVKDYHIVQNMVYRRQNAFNQKCNNNQFRLFSYSVPKNNQSHNKKQTKNRKEKSMQNKNIDKIALKKLLNHYEQVNEQDSEADFSPYIYKTKRRRAQLSHQVTQIKLVDTESQKTERQLNY